MSRPSRVTFITFITFITFVTFVTSVTLIVRITDYTDYGISRIFYLFFVRHSGVVERKRGGAELQKPTKNCSTFGDRLRHLKTWHIQPARHGLVLLSFSLSLLLAQRSNRFPMWTRGTCSDGYILGTKSDLSREQGNVFYIALFIRIKNRLNFHLPKN